MAVIFRPFPREPFRELMERLVGFGAIWDGSAVPFAGPRNGKPGSILKIDVIGVMRLGHDEVRKAWDQDAQGGNGANAVEAGGQRVYRLSFRVESFDFDIPGYDPLEDLRLKLRFATTLRELEEMGLSFVDAGDVIPVNYNTDNRPAFAAVCEIRFGFAAQQSVTDDSGGVIETVNGGIPKQTIGNLPFIPIE